MQQDLQLNFTPRPLSEWKQLLLNVPRSNWMQTWPYAQALFKRDYKISRLATVERDNQTIALIQLQEIRLGPIHFVELQRGPLWMNEQSTLENFRDFALLFRKTFPRRVLRRLRWLPEWEDSPEVQNTLTDFGFKKLKPTFETIFLNLTPPEQTLLALLKPKWRNSLHKARRSHLEIETGFAKNRLGGTRFLTPGLWG